MKSLRKKINVIFLSLDSKTFQLLPFRSRPKGAFRNAFLISNDILLHPFWAKRSSILLTVLPFDAGKNTS